MKKILIMCLGDIRFYARFRRMSQLLMEYDSFDLSLAAFIGDMDGVEFFKIKRIKNTFFFKLYRRILGLAISISPFESLRILLESCRFGLLGLKDQLGASSFDLIIIENLELLPLAFKIKKDARILFDAREYYPKQNEESFWFNFVEKPRRIQLCRNYMARSDVVVTVSEGLREAFKEEFGISSVLYRSTPSYVDMPVRLTDKDHIKMVYHGAANRNRQLENLIEILGLLDSRFSLDFFLVGSPGYQSELKKLASNDSRIRFMKPVIFDAIIPTISKYDIGFFYYESDGFNVMHCLPNKFFEYIQARVMVAIGPSPDMAQLVKNTVVV